MKIRKPKHSEKGKKREKSLSLTAALQRSYLDLLVDQPKNNERKITFDIRGGRLESLLCSDVSCLVCSRGPSWCWREVLRPCVIC